MSLVQKVVSGTKWTALSTFYKVVIQFLQITLLANLLPLEELGMMSVISIFMLVAEITTDFGISRAIIQEEKVTSTQLSSLFWVNISAGILFAALTYTGAGQIASYFHNEELESLLALFSLIFLINAVGVQYNSLLQKDLMFRELNLIQLGATTVGFTVTITMALLGHGVVSIVWGNLALACFNTFFFFYFGSSKHLPAFVFKFHEIRHLLSFGLYQTGERLIGIFRVHLDKILIGNMLGLDILGVYTIAWTLLAMPVSKLNPVILKTAFPVFAKLKNEIQQLNVYYKNILNALISINFPILCGLAIISDEFTEIFYNKPELAQAAFVIKVLTVVSLDSVIGNPGGAVFHALGKAKLTFYWNLFYTTASAVLVYMILLHWPSLEGILFARIIVTFSIGLIWHFLIHKAGMINYLPILKDTVHVLGICLVMIGIGMVIDYLSLTNLYFSLILKIVSGGLIYSGLYWIINKEKVRQVKVLFSR